MTSPVIEALQNAYYTGSSPKGQFWAFRHPNPDAPPQTYRVTRRHANGWMLLLAASKETKDVLAFFVETEEDKKAVVEALKWLGIQGEIATGTEGAFLTLASGKMIPSVMYGGEKKKK